MPVSDAQPQISEVLTETERELQHLRHEIEMLTKAGVIEVAIRNPSVREYMNHWEKRAEKAEAALEAAALDAHGAEWQPIETSPSDGRDIIVCGGRHEKPEIVPADGGWWRIEKLLGTPTHWAPVPAAPSTGR